MQIAILRTAAVVMILSLILPAANVHGLSPASGFDGVILPAQDEMLYFPMVTKNHIVYLNDFSRYRTGYPPEGWIQRGTNEITPTVIEFDGTGPDHNMVHFPEVHWQYWDKWLLYPEIDLIEPDYIVKVMMRFNNSIADRAGMTIAWNDQNWDRIEIQPNVYHDDIEFRVAYSGPNPSNIVINTLSSITIDAGVNYWLKAIAHYPGPGLGQVDVYWSTNNVDFIHVLKVTGLPDLTGITGMSTAGPHLPSTYFDNFSITTIKESP